MSYDDENERWPRWRRWPYFGRVFGDIDEIFREMEEILTREFEDITKRVPRDLMREKTLPDGSKAHEWGPFVYGYSITIGPDGKPKIRKFGNVKQEAKFGKPQIDIKEEREPLIDIISSDKGVKVIAELPGVDKKDIKLHGTEKILTISVETPQRKFFKELELPSRVDPSTASSSYKNGVLEVTLQRKPGEKPKGEPIRIE